MHSIQHTARAAAQNLCIVVQEVHELAAVRRGGDLHALAIFLQRGQQAGAERVLALLERGELSSA